MYVISGYFPTTIADLSNYNETLWLTRLKYLLSEPSQTKLGDIDLDKCLKSLYCHSVSLCEVMGAIHASVCLLLKTGGKSQ